MFIKKNKMQVELEDKMFNLSLIFSSSKNKANRQHGNNKETRPENMKSYD